MYAAVLIHVWSPTKLRDSKGEDMALINCHECGAKVSTQAKVCPGCGVKPKKATSMTTWVVGGVVLSAILFSLATAPPEPAAKVKTPEEIAQAEADEKMFQRVVAALRRLKATMKDPSSFELVTAEVTPAEVLCVTYRARNGFNAITPGVHIFTAEMGTDDVAVFNMHCSGPMGKDYRHARHAL